VANEEPAFVELTQLRIHCITLGNNRSRTSPPPLPLSFSVVCRPFPFVLVLFSVSLLARFPSLAFSENVTVPFTFARVPGKLGFCYFYTMSIFILCPIFFLASRFSFTVYRIHPIFHLFTELKIISDIRYRR